MIVDDQYLPIWQAECQVCGAAPIVGMRSPSGHIISTGMCGPHFFGDKAMIDPDNWNNQMETTE